LKKLKKGTQGRRKSLCFISFPSEGPTWSWGSK
jgi:hypothetical protein